MPWDPTVEADPSYHLDHIRAGLRQAASHLPRVDAIGCSSAGIYIDDKVKVASLFRSVEPQAFADRVERMFMDIGSEWGVPIRVINDGDVTALAGAIFAAIGAYLGSTIPWYLEHYEFEHVLILGRVTSGEGGEILAARARAVLTGEFPEIAERVSLHMPDENSRRVGQAVAAASLPE